MIRRGGLFLFLVLSCLLNHPAMAKGPSDSDRARALCAALTVSADKPVADGVRPLALYVSGSSRTSPNQAFLCFAAVEAQRTWIGARFTAFNGAGQPVFAFDAHTDCTASSSGSRPECTDARFVLTLPALTRIRIPYRHCTYEEGYDTKASIFYQWRPATGGSHGKDYALVPIVALSSVPPWQDGPCIPVNPVTREAVEGE